MKLRPCCLYCRASFEASAGADFPRFVQPSVNRLYARVNRAHPLSLRAVARERGHFCRRYRLDDGPIFGVIMVDYYLIRNGEIDVSELYREGARIDTLTAGTSTRSSPLRSGLSFPASCRIRGRDRRRGLLPPRQDSRSVRRSRGSTRMKVGFAASPET